MNFETRLLITAIMIMVTYWLLRNFFRKRVSSGQTLFWLVMLGGGMVLAVIPGVVHFVSRIWGGLWPISWITFASLVFLTFYLLYLTIRLNSLSKLNDLVRNIAHLERRLRELEQENRALRETPSGR